MSESGPIGEAIIRARKLQARCVSIETAIGQAFHSSSDADLPRSLVAALVRIIEEPDAKTASVSAGPTQWFPYHLFFSPVVLSAATLRAAKVVEGASGVGVAVGMPRRANDFPEVTPFGLRVFYLASLARSRSGGPTFSGLDKILVDVAETSGVTIPSLADALLLLLVPDFRSYEKNVANGFDAYAADSIRELFAIALVLADLRSGKLPNALPGPSQRLATEMLETESLHGMFHAGLRFQAGKAGLADAWPALIESFLVRPEGKPALAASPDVPLLICSLAATWIRVRFHGLSQDRKGVVLADFRALISGCGHSHAEALEVALNRAIA